VTKSHPAGAVLRGTNPPSSDILLAQRDSRPTTRYEFDAGSRLRRS
jgi:hypothetical protein